MKILWQELVKIAKQIHGSENIFGYKSTVANQLYLLYCFSGKIYFTDKIHKQVKYLWYGIVSNQIIFSFVIGLAYLWYGGGEGEDFVVIFNVIIAMAAFLAGVVVIPLILFLYSNSIEMMIERVDNILSMQRASDSNQENVLIGGKKNVLALFGAYIIFMTINLSVCFLDIVFFFEENKVKNYLYYAFPVFLNQKFNSMVSFFIINGISTIFFVMVVWEGCLGLRLILYWSTVWYNELGSLRDELNTALRDFDVYFGEGEQSKCSDAWNNTFNSILRRSIKRFRKITLLIDDLRGFVEVYGTMFVFGNYFFNLFFLYNTFSSDISVVLMVKNLSACSALIISGFSFNWIGQNLENLVSEVSMAIYSTPWYRSVKVRKNVYIFLHQTKSVKNFTIFKVYQLLFNNFARYLHGLVAYTNVLLQLAQK